MINKKNLLGKQPEELGTKDAIHVAIVSVRAGQPIAPGSRCSLNKNREAIEDSKGPGVADPFLKRNIRSGERFWLLLAQDEIANVQHNWDHPTLDFSPPEVEVKQNREIKRVADMFGVTYEQVIEAAQYVVDHNSPAPYPGGKEPWEMRVKNKEEFDRYDFWRAWADETLYEFENYGSECCPEYKYPRCDLFQSV